MAGTGLGLVRSGSAAPEQISNLNSSAGVSGGQEKSCKMTFMEDLNKTHSELAQRRKKENHIRAWRSIERTEKGDHA